MQELAGPEIPREGEVGEAKAEGRVTAAAIRACVVTGLPTGRVGPSCAAQTALIKKRGQQIKLAIAAVVAACTQADAASWAPMPSGQSGEWTVEGICTRLIVADENLLSDCTGAPVCDGERQAELPRQGKHRTTLARLPIGSRD